VERKVYLYFLSVFVCLLCSCSIAPKVCILQHHWDRDTKDIAEINERNAHCIPVDWNIERITK